MELGKILEEEVMLRKIYEIGYANIAEEIEKISKTLSWCSRKGEKSICNELIEALDRASSSLAKLRIFKTLGGIDPGDSFDKEILRSVSHLVESYASIFKGYPMDPYERVPVRSNADLSMGNIKLRRGYVHMIHIVTAVRLAACGIVEFIEI
ncbi:MAG: hypothetical protein DJ555_04565 [Desulfurococcaceae archaeon]|nr:MAG: hypothetical protein DJ555_04565 [Desulfurococcaceae archaeon]